ncbi:MAG: aminoglycoside N(3)-acetyltransferase [Verrucomicrobiales bacterium]
MSEATSLQSAGRPATIDSVVAGLRALGVTDGSLLLVHSSLSSLGWVSGGAVAVVEALQRAVGSRGTLVMPTHSTQLSEPSHWENPPVPESWWPIIRESMPPYDPGTTPTRGMGAIPEYFRTLPDSVRGEHPQWSFTAAGPVAGEIVGPHAPDSCLGDDSPLGRIYAEGGSVLLLGVDHDRNTSLHLAEQRAFAESSATRRNGAPMTIGGSRCWAEFEEFDFPDTDFCEIGNQLRTTTGIVKSGQVACAGAELMSQPALVDFAVKWLGEH